MSTKFGTGPLIDIKSKEELLEMSTEEIKKLDSKVWSYWKLINVVNEFKNFKED
jgi:hypothetical protein|tara:strand:+ start:146 stop:307 length:162 start_codon:yes stop_codon:yes gene_type:complete